MESNPITVLIYNVSFKSSPQLWTQDEDEVHDVLVLSGRSLRACVPTEQGYCAVSRGSCYDTHTTGSSSQLAVKVCRWDSGRSPRLWWFGTACSSGSRCTGRSTGAGRGECCSSPGEPVEWAPVTGSCLCTVPAPPTGNTTHTNTQKQVRLNHNPPPLTRTFPPL